MKIALQNTSWGEISILRQTSQYSGLVKNGSYLINKSQFQVADYGMINNIDSDFPEIKKERRVFIYMENPIIWIPDKELIANCGYFISPFDLSSQLPKHVKFIRSQPCVPWFYGIDFCTNSGLIHKPLRSKIELDRIESLEPPRKSKLLSIIASGKAGTPGHAWRHEIANNVKNYFGDNVDIFGFGHKPIPDKRIAIDPYYFSIVIENIEEDFYITEKIADALIGWSMPIYAGGKKVNDLLEREVPNIKFGCSVEEAILAIKAAISIGVPPHHELKKMRDNAIDRLNLFTEMPRILNSQ